MRIQFVLLAFLISCLCTQAQKNPCPVDNKAANKLFKKSGNAFNNKHDRRAAMQLLKDAIEVEPIFAEAQFWLAEFYFGDKKYSEALTHYSKLLELCPEYKPLAHFKAALSSYHISDFKSCATRFRSYLDLPAIVAIKDETITGSNAEWVRISKAESMSEECTFKYLTLGNPVPFDPKPLPNICTEYNEYLPVLSPDNEIFLFIRSHPSNRKSTFGGIRMVEDFTMATLEDGVFNRGSSMPAPFNRGSNEGGATLTIDNLEMYITICNRDDGEGSCDLYYTRKVDEEWEVPINMNEFNPNINTEQWESQVSISSDGTTLYFAAHKDGGYGGMDIYKILKNAAGEWSDPINLGPNVNSSQDDKSPFIHVDDQTLYFSSKGHVGLGDFDIFLCRKDSTGEFGSAMNIGYPINSEASDLGFFVSTDGKTGYFSSNQTKGGAGGWDIYSFPLYKGARPKRVLFLKGDIRDEYGEVVWNASLELKDMKTNKVTRIPVDSITGKYIFAKAIENDHMLVAQKKGHFYESAFIDGKDSTISKPRKVDFTLETITKGATFQMAKRPDMENLLFDTDSYELKPEAKAELGNLLTFMQINFDLHIGIHGHTDNIGDRHENLLLSKNRAKEVWNYLHNNGIPSERMSFKGFGESQPIAGNNTEMGRKRNRRTEIKIN